MKPLLVLARITFVGCLWSIIFIEGIRVILLEHWRFDIFWPAHWAYAWGLWQSGWVIDTPKEWAFILILLAFIPLWLTGWIALSLVPWENLVFKVLSWPLKFLKGSVEPLAQAVANSTPIVTKKKSYKEVRPTGKRVPIYDYNTPSSTTAPVVASVSATPASLPTSSYVSNPVKDRAVSARETLNHTIFDLDDEDDDFDLDIDSFDKSDIFKIDSNKKKTEDKDEYTGARKKESMSVKKSAKFDLDEEDDDEDLENYEPPHAPKRKTSAHNDEEPLYPKKDNQLKSEKIIKPERTTQTKQSGGAIGDILEEKGYDVLRNIQLKKILLDYVAVSSDSLLICLIDKESGDWLADEESFNDEEPLWFSESSHRVSPVRKVDLAREKIEKVLEDSNLGLDVKPYVIVISGNIINAEDMQDTWSDMKVQVVRFAKGSPTDLLPLSKAVDKAEKRLSQNDFNELKKLLKKIE